MRNVTTLLLLLVIAACSAEENGAGPAVQKGHVWQEQTDMIERAKGVEDLLGEANLQRRQQLDEQAR